MSTTAVALTPRGLIDDPRTVTMISSYPPERTVADSDDLGRPRRARERPGSDATGSFAEFYAATFRSLCAQLYVHTGDPTEAQDVVQEAFTRALPRWQRLARAPATARTTRSAWAG